MALPVQKTTTIFRLSSNETLFTTPQRVGQLWDKVVNTPCFEAAKPHLYALGIGQKDLKAQNRLFPLMLEACKKDVNIQPDERNSGVYFLSRNSDRFAVFKVGSKRASMELQVRKIAHRLGLEEHAIPGVFCTIENPRFIMSEPIQEELWNGLVKIYTSGEDIPYEQSVYSDAYGLEQTPTLTGILEPFLEKKEEPTVLEMAKMTVLAIILGLRDAKSDGIAGSTLLDVEDCMPTRFFLKPGETPNSSVAALHLPYLDNERAQTPLSSDDLDVLLDLVDENQLKVMHFLSELEREEISFFDHVSEDLIQDDASSDDESEELPPDTGWDHGGCFVEIEAPTKTMESYPVIKNVKQGSQMFLTEQLTACSDRIIRLKKVLRLYRSTQGTPTIVEIVSNVDPTYGAQLKALRVQTPRVPLHDCIGRFSPKAMKDVFSYLPSILPPDPDVLVTIPLVKRGVSAPS